MEVQACSFSFAADTLAVNALNMDSVKEMSRTDGNACIL